jgi:hypothetical protein
MDDLKMVRDAYGEIASGAPLKSRIETMLAAETVRAARMGEGGAVMPRRRRWGGRAVVLGTVAAAVAAAVAFTVVGGGPAMEPAPALLSARTILLAAADRAGAEPEGRFWRSHVVESRTARAEGAKPYTIVTPYEHDWWRARADDGTDVSFQRTLAARPLGTADREAWERAGSPSSFTVRYGKELRTFAARDGAWEEKRATPDDRRQEVLRLCAFSGESAEKCAQAPKLTRDDRQRIAADPKRFQERLFPPGLPPEDTAAALQRSFYFLIFEAASPETRASSFRLLADLPGVRSDDGVTLPDGRRAVAIAADGTVEPGGATFEYTIMFDPDTYEVVGDRQTVTGGSILGIGAGTPFGETTVMQAGWTAETPRHD